MLDGLVAYMNCTPLDTNAKTTYIRTSLNVQCQTKAYINLKNSFIYPVTFGLHFLIPLALLVLLLLKKSRLHENKYRMSLGTIYNDYKDEGYYWGLILVIFKILLVIFSQFLKITIETK